MGIRMEMRRMKMGMEMGMIWIHNTSSISSHTFR